MKVARRRSGFDARTHQLGTPICRIRESRDRSNGFVRPIGLSRRSTDRSESADPDAGDGVVSRERCPGGRLRPSVEDDARRGDRQAVGPFAGERSALAKNARGSPTFRELCWQRPEHHDGQAALAGLKAEVRAVEVESQRRIEPQRHVAPQDQQQLVEGHDRAGARALSRSTRPRSTTQPIRSAAAAPGGSTTSRPHKRPRRRSARTAARPRGAVRTSAGPNRG